MQKNRKIRNRIKKLTIKGMAVPTEDSFILDNLEAEKMVSCI